MKRFASIDLGSNTIRLLIGEKTDALRPIHEERRIIRLGEGLHEAKRLLEHRMTLAIETLNGFRDTCRNFGEVFIYAAATSAVREASNRDEFVRRVKQETGLTLHVIPWQEEAALTLEGVLWKLPLGDRRFLTFDIGGGSTEFILSKGNEVIATAGTRLGVVRLTERFITKHPVEEDEYSALENFLGEELQQVKTTLGNVTPEMLVGTAGTVTTLVALDQNIYPYDVDRVHGTTLLRKRIEFLLRDLCQMTLEERRQLKPLERGREDLIIVGTTLTLEILKAFQCAGLTVSEYGLREGLLLKAERESC